MSYLTANMKMITECADKLAHLGEKLFNETEMKYRAGNKVRIKSLDWYNENKGMNGLVGLFTPSMKKLCGMVVTLDSAYNGKYTAMEKETKGYYLDDSMIEGLVEEEKKDMGEISDGYHTFNELYEYRLLYNASMFNELAKQNLYDVHKSKRHSDGEIPFGDANWFIVMAELPTGQVSNHYEIKDWDLFDIPEKDKANIWDGHTPKDVAERLRKFLTPKPKYPKSYEECCKVMRCAPWFEANTCYHGKELSALYRILICRDAYWKIAGDWKPDYDSGVDKFGIICYDGVVSKTGAMSHWERHSNKILEFPTIEMRDAFFENFEELINECKELL